LRKEPKSKMQLMDWVRKYQDTDGFFKTQREKAAVTRAKKTLQGSVSRKKNSIAWKKYWILRPRCLT
ncbi:hypothetical protein, partial [Peribacillus simplex]|uniref:hypothetical protein n=1 Tax=Peribacillus simplex TaxID=1478 RepID=UPI003D2D2FF1